jgi:iron(III) transport system substrate-binding protein
MMRKFLLGGLAALSLTLSVPAATAQELTLYSGRGEALIGPVIAQFQRQSGIKVNVRYGGTAELATLLQEEGSKSPADVFWAQDGGALGAIASLFVALPAQVNKGVAAPFRNVNNKWAPTSGRSRVLIYSTQRVKKGDIPASITDLTDGKYKGRVAWAPTNAGFQAFVTAFRVAHGEQAARKWLEGMIANGTRVYRNNGTQVEAIANGEVDFGLVNNYYLGRYVARDPKFPVAQTLFKAGDIGNLVNVAGAGIIATSKNQANARKFMDYLLSPAAQQYIAVEGYEYPVIPGIIGHPTHAAFDTIVELSPEIDIDKIADLKGTLKLLRDVGLL